MTMQKRLLFLFGVTLLLTTGCSRNLKTREIQFWRDPSVGSGLPIAVDVVYPVSIEQREELLRDFKKDTSEAWFHSRVRDTVQKDKEDIQPEAPGQRVSVKPKTPKDLGILIFAEFGQRPQEGSGAIVKPNHKAVIQFNKLTEPQPRKREYIRIGPGYMERLKNRPTEFDE